MRATAGIAALMMIGVFSLHASAHVRPAAKLKPATDNRSIRSAALVARGLTVLPADDSGEDDSGDTDDSGSEDSQ